MKIGSNVVTDGLIFYVDAANTNSYIPDNTIVDSMVSEFTGSLINDVAFNSSPPSNFEFGLSGVDDYIDFGEASDSSFTSSFDPQTNNYTANIFFKIDSDNATTAVIMGKGCGSSSIKGWLIWYSNSTGILNYRVSGKGTLGNQDPSQRANVEFSINKNQIYMSTFVIDRTNNQIIGYLNGRNPQTASISGFDPFISPYKFLIGTRHQLNLSLNGNVYLAQIYNRALSAKEVLQNYNALKNRFN
tara:strand:+ start:101 stop:832 length:732 start_codon:yes stop_codon:yes gene_type:complete